MHKSVTVLLLLLMVSSCQKKKQPDIVVQRTDNYIKPDSQDEIDTSQVYISPSDAFNDRSSFDKENFQFQRIRYRGTRNLSYTIVSSEAMNNDLTVVTEYLQGTNEHRDSILTATRLLVYTKKELVYRKAFPIEFLNTAQFSSHRKFDHIVYTVSRTKAIIYYWIKILRKNDLGEKEYHAVCIDYDGVANELSGDLNRVGVNHSSIRFLNETRLRARVPPTARYPYLTIDLNYFIDWKTCSALLEVPVDTIFTVAEQPSRFFSRKIKLHTTSNRTSLFRETNFRRLTKGQMLRIFIPSFFNIADSERDMVFVEFNRTTSGWIDYSTMMFEEIISEK